LIAKEAGARRQRDGSDLNVRAGGLRHLQAAQREQGDHCVFGCHPEPGGDQDRAELVAV